MFALATDPFIPMGLSSMPAHLCDLLNHYSRSPRLSLIPTTLSPIQSIQFMEDGKRIRKVVKRSNRKMSCKFPSRKNGLMHQCESSVEYKGYRIFECMSLVKSYMDQPALIRFTMNGIALKHYPDALVELKNGVMVFVEFKYQLKFGEELLVERSRFLAQNLPAHGYQYVLILASQVQGIPQHNATKMLRGGIKDISRNLRESVRRILNSHGTMMIQDLLAILPAADIRDIYALIWSGDLTHDVFCPLTRSTFIQLANGK